MTSSYDDVPFYLFHFNAMKGSELFCVQNKFGGLPYTHNMKSWWWWCVLWRFAICHTSQGRLSHDQLNITLEAKIARSFLYCPKVSTRSNHDQSFLDDILCTNWILTRFLHSVRVKSLKSDTKSHQVLLIPLRNVFYHCVHITFLCLICARI